HQQRLAAPEVVPAPVAELHVRADAPIAGAELDVVGEPAAEVSPGPGAHDVGPVDRRRVDHVGLALRTEPDRRRPPGSRGVDGPADDAHDAAAHVDHLVDPAVRHLHDRLLEPDERPAPRAVVDRVGADHPTAGRRGHLEVEPVAGAERRVRGPHVRADVAGRAVRDELVVDVDADVRRAVVVLGDGSATHPHRPPVGARREVEVAPRFIQARPVVGAGRVVGARAGAALRVELPRRLAGHDPADDRPDAADVLVALPVAEPGAAGLAVPAVALGAPAARPGAGAAADAVGAAPAAAALRVAVQVVAGRATAERGPVDLPPAGGDRPGRAGVGAGQRAAEFGVAVAAQRAAAAAAPVAVAHRRVRAARLEPE